MRTPLVGRTIGFYLSAALFVLAMMVTQRLMTAQSKGMAKGYIGGNSSAAAGCDRECLRGFMTQYLDAMVTNNPSALRLAGNVRFTENTEAAKPSESELWKATLKIRPYRQDILDVRDGVAGTHVIVEEDGNPVMLLVRLKVVDRKISEIETQIARNRQEGAIFQPDLLTTPTPTMNMAVPAAQRNSREEMIKAAVLYPAGLMVGSFVTVDAPFAPDAYRLENGRRMAGKGCVFRPPSCEDIKKQKLLQHPAITYRVAAVDEELGITWLRMNFGPRGSAEKGPVNELIVWEAFKVFGGQIHAVEAFMRNMPVGSGSGWDDVYPPKVPKVP